MTKQQLALRLLQLEALTQSNVANRLDLSQALISRMLKGTRSMSDSQAGKIIDLYLTLAEQIGSVLEDSILDKEDPNVIPIKLPSNLDRVEPEDANAFIIVAGRWLAIFPNQSEAASWLAEQDVKEF